MIYLKLFLTFMKIGVVSFGGGYGMLSLIREECLRFGWLTEEEFLDFIAVAESTPGPIAVNMSTFIGSTQGGILGALSATLGVVLPSFIIILLIASLLTRLLKYAGVKAVIESIRPAVVGLITATALIMFIGIIFGIKTIESEFSFDWRSLLIFGIVFGLSFGYKVWRKKSFPAILLILISGGLGVLMFGL